MGVLARVCAAQKIELTELVDLSPSAFALILTAASARSLQGAMILCSAMIGLTAAGPRRGPVMSVFLSELPPKFRRTPG
jgi:hypothetical protein